MVVKIKRFWFIITIALVVLVLLGAAYLKSQLSAGTVLVDFVLQDSCRFGVVTIDSQIVDKAEPAHLKAGRHHVAADIEGSKYFVELDFRNDGYNFIALSCRPPEVYQLLNPSVDDLP